MLFGLSPIGADIFGFPAEVITMHSHEGFTPNCALKNETVSIGCGNGIEHFKKALEHRNADIVSLVQTEVGSPGGMGLAMSMELGSILFNNPTRGISRHAHYTTVRVNGEQARVEIHSLNLTAHSVDGRIEKLVMPPVAQSWQEFTQMMHSRGLNASAAIA